ncbi:hypothetical protein GGF31_001510 [Allomyces arbusculus]|nr:hypothetical protein GGF31_001510 [Allomyces arbusculus]
MKDLPSLGGKFTTTMRTPRAFINTFERLAVANGLPRQYWVYMLGQHMSNDVAAWWTLLGSKWARLPVEQRATLDQWDWSVAKLLACFANDEDMENELAKAELYRVKQRGHPVRAYMLEWVFKLSLVLSPPSARTLITRFINGLDAEFQQALGVTDFGTVDEVMAACEIYVRRIAKRLDLESTERFTGTCHYCGNASHVVKDCRTKSADMKKSVDRKRHPRYEQNHDRSTRKAKGKGKPVVAQCGH